MGWRVSLSALGAAAALGAGVAWTQVQPTERQPPPPTGPTPTEVVLTPDRAQVAALALARRDPLAARLQGVLRQAPETAPILSQIQASPVPVLGPDDPALLRTARFYRGDRQYSLVVRRPDQIIEIFGATKALQPPPGATLPPPAGTPAAPPTQRPPLNRAVVGGLGAARAAAAQRGLTDIVTEQTEYGVDVAFSRFGAAYNLTFVCDALGPPDCTEASALAFAASLQLLGGGGQ